MPKYYITDSYAELIVNEKNPRYAALRFINNYQGRGVMIKPVIKVSEIGFDDDRAARFNTDLLMRSGNT